MRRQRCSRGLPTPGLFSAMFHVEPSGRTDVPRGTLGTCSRIAQWALHSNRELAVIGETTPSPADPKDLKAQCGCSHSRVHLVRALHAHHRCAFPMRIPHAHSPPHAYSSCASMIRIDYAYDPPRAGHHHPVWPHGRGPPRPTPVQIAPTRSSKRSRQRINRRPGSDRSVHRIWPARGLQDLVSRLVGLDVGLAWPRIGCAETRGLASAGNGAQLEGGRQRQAKPRPVDCPSRPMGGWRPAPQGRDQSFRAASASPRSAW